jgi:2-alkyl-3-oxoalkanoate reductase
MTVLVTGATGFLGTRLVRALTEGGIRVRVLARNTPSLESMQRAGSVEPYSCDLRDRDAVIAACQGASMVFHLGALTAAWGPRSEFHGINVEGTKSLVMGCRIHGVRRLIYPSTPLVQFDGMPQVEIKEDVPYASKLLSHLAATKQEAEKIVLAALGETLSVIVLRFGPVYGPGDRRFLPPLLSLAHAEKLPQIGNGRNRLELVYRDNAIRALLLASEMESVSGVYNIGGGEPVYLWSVLRGWLGQAGTVADLPTVTQQTALAKALAWETLAGLTGQPPTLTRAQVYQLGVTQTLDGTAAERDLGYKPVVAQSEGIARVMHALSIRD